MVIFWSIPWIYRHCWRCQAIITKQCKNSTRPELFCSTLVLVRCKSQFVFYIFSLYEKFPLIVRILILIIGFFGVIGTKNKLWREKSFFNMVDQKTKKNLHKFSVNDLIALKKRTVTDMKKHYPAPKKNHRWCNHERSETFDLARFICRANIHARKWPLVLSAELIT